MRTRQPLHADDAAGFTLFEALVAIALMAMILTSLATITAQWMPNWNRGMARVQGDEDLALGLDRFVADLAAAAFVPANRQTMKPYFEGANQSVAFVRTALSPNVAPGLEIVHFAEVKGANGSVLVRTRAPFVPAERANSREEPHFSDPVALIGAPYTVSLSYAGADRVWRDTWQQQLVLPHAVRLTVRDAKSGRALATSTATLLHAEIPADCLGAKSFAACLATLQPTADNNRPPEPAFGQPR